MFDRVVVGVRDEDETARDAVALGRALVSPRGTLTLLHVKVVGDEPADGALTAIDVEDRTRALKRLPALAAACSVEAEIAWVVARSVRRGLHRFATDHHADLLVVATSKQDELGRVFVGDDTVEVLRDAPVAVAVAPAGWSAPTATLQRVGVGYDGSPGSEPALMVGRALARRHGARLSAFEAVREPIAVHDVWNIEDEIADLVDAARRRLSALGDLEADAGAGDPADELARYGRSVDVLVLGGHRPKPVDQLLGGSTAHRLADDAPCALVVLPPQARAPKAEGRPGDVTADAAALERSVTRALPAARMPSPRPCRRT
jgi:nucleotide-binding universal stress UspA family protein